MHLEKKRENNHAKIQNPQNNKTKPILNQTLVPTEIKPLQKGKKGFLKSAYIFHGVGLKHLFIFHLCMTWFCSSNSI